jgi:hypothetical protein
MASEQTVLNVLGRAFWDPTPTGTDLRARQLAAAMGYPTTWRVVRTVDTIQGRSMIADRIYAGKPDTDCDAWFHHEAAMKAAAAWNDESSTAFSNAGGHLLPREPLFDKHDKVQVMYEGEWWDAKVLRRKTHNEGFRYQVQYVQDHSKQTGVDERLIRPRQDLNHDAFALAKQQGFGEGWQATAHGKRWKVIAPDGTVYTRKKSGPGSFSRGGCDTSSRRRRPSVAYHATRILGAIYTVDYNAQYFGSPEHKCGSSWESCGLDCRNGCGQGWTTWLCLRAHQGARAALPHQVPRRPFASLRVVFGELPGFGRARVGRLSNSRG